MGQHFALSNMFDFTEKFLEQNGIFTTVRGLTGA